MYDLRETIWYFSSARIVITIFMLLFSYILLGQCPTSGNVQFRAAGESSRRRHNPEWTYLL